MNPIEIIKQKRIKEKWFVRLHHRLMKEYGWIPFNEFKKMPLPTLWNLVDEINEDIREERKTLNKINRRRKIK